MKALNVCFLLVIGVLGPGSRLLAQTPDDTVAETSYGRDFGAVNGNVIRCELPGPETPEELAAHEARFSTNPLDLDAISRKIMGDSGKLDPKFAEFLERQAERRKTDWPYLCRYRDANVEVRSGKHRPNVVFMGDSITENWIAARPDFFENGYLNRGISGQSSSQMVARFYADVVSLHPKVVHLMTGTNDVGGATGPVTEDEFIYNVQAMIDLARINGIEVILASIPPMTRLLPRPDFDVRPVVESMNERLRVLADERKVAYIDYYAQLVDSEGAFNVELANDGVHPTRAGYRVMEPLARQAISRALHVHR